MFRREIHRAMEKGLAEMDVATLDAHGFALGRATGIALAWGEVRESADLDFIGSDARGWIPAEAWASAERAYGPSVRDDLGRVIQRFRSDEDRRRRHLRALRVEDVDLVVGGVEDLAVDLGLDPPVVE